MADIDCVVSRANHLLTLMDNIFLDIINDNRPDVCKHTHLGLWEH